MPLPFDLNTLFKRIRSLGVPEWQDTINKKLLNAILDLMTKSNEIIEDINNGNYPKRQNFSGNQDGSNKVFTLDFALKSGSEQIFIDSAFLANKANCDYTLSGTNLEFTFSPQIDDFITIFGIKE